MIMTEEKTIKIRDLVRDIDLEEAGIASWTEAIEAATVYAIQLGYQGLSAGTGGFYADTEVTESHAEIIMDLICNTDERGVYTGDLGRIADIAAE